MKTLSKLRRSYYAAPLATALACAIAVLTFSPYATAPASAAAVAPYSGQELVDGLLFGIGPVADHLPEVYGNSRLPDDAGAEIRELMYSHIGATSPEFFDDFSTAVQSGNHVQIAATLENAGQAVSDAYRQIAPDSPWKKSANSGRSGRSEWL